jgi:hypothetical protein
MSASMLNGKRGLVFVGVVFISFMQVGLYAGRRSSEATSKRWLLSSFSKSHPVINEHPIPKLMADAEKEFRNLLSRQSDTLKKAVVEYKRRYNRDPPKGFDEWWHFAQENNVKLIDEYDGLVEDLAPFWDISGEEFRVRAEEASYA